MTNSALSLRDKARAEVELRKRRAELSVVGTYQPWREVARPKQIAPEGRWRYWLLLAGRGFGKSRSICEWAREQAFAMPGSRGALVAPTAGDVRDVLVEGESGILAKAPPDFRPVYEPSKRRLTWPNGTIATTFSADEPERLRGPQHHWAICDELRAWRYPEAFDNLMLGLRLGHDPRCAIATTPRITRLIKQLIKNPHTVLTVGTTYENRANLAADWFEDIIRQYEGTRLGRQELEAIMLEDVEGALWSRALIESCQWESAVPLPDFTRKIVAIDPAATANEDSNETGIIVAGKDHQRRAFILADLSFRGSPIEWAQKAVGAYHTHEADCIVIEANQGGDMAEHTLRTVDPLVPIVRVWASRGKHTRAEPVSALYEQKRVYHVSGLGELEDQLCTWTVDDESPDRLDATVWAVHELIITDTRPTWKARSG